MVLPIPAFRAWLATLLCLAAVASVRAEDDASFADDGFADEVYSVDGAPCLDGDCASPSPQFEVWATLLYLRPGSGNLEYATLVSPLPLPTPNWANQALTPSYSPAFNVGLRYVVPATGHDIRAAWTHLDASAEASVTGDSNQFVGPSYEIGPDASLFREARGNVDFDYDSITLDAGQLLCTGGGGARVRVFGGLEFARIGQTLTATFRSEDDLFSNGNETHSLFKGVGPRLGMRADMVHGSFDFLGEIAGSALVGTMESRLDFSARSPEIDNLDIASPNRQSLTSPNTTQVVPALGTKLGAGCTLLGGPGRGCLRVEAGYQASVYFNAINRYSITEVDTPPVDQSVGVFLRTADHLQTNFTVHGPYAAATWAF